MTTTTDTPAIAPEKRVAYTSTKGTTMAKKMPWGSQKPGGMRKMGGMRSEGAMMPKVKSPDIAKGFAMGKKWSSHHGSGGAMNAVGNTMGAVD